MAAYALDTAHRADVLWGHGSVPKCMYICSVSGDANQIVGTSLFFGVKGGRGVSFSGHASASIYSSFRLPGTEYFILVLSLYSVLRIRLAILPLPLFRGQLPTTPMHSYSKNSVQMLEVLDKRQSLWFYTISAKPESSGLRPDGLGAVGPAPSVWMKISSVEPWHHGHFQLRLLYSVGIFKSSRQARGRAERKCKNIKRGELKMLPI